MEKTKTTKSSLTTATVLAIISVGLVLASISYAGLVHAQTDSATKNMTSGANQ
jgi:hypothetical protein